MNEDSTIYKKKNDQYIEFVNKTYFWGLVFVIGGVLIFYIYAHIVFISMKLPSDDYNTATIASLLHISFYTILLLLIFLKSPKAIPFICIWSILIIAGGLWHWFKMLIGEEQLLPRTTLLRTTLLICGVIFLTFINKCVKVVNRDVNKFVKQRDRAEMK